MNQNLEDELLQIVSTALSRPLSSLKRNLHLEADLGLDSLSLASLTTKFEKFLIHHPDVHQVTASLMASTTLGEFLDFILDINKEKIHG